MKRSTGSRVSTPLCTASCPAKGPPLMAQEPTATTSFGAGVASQVFSRARRIFSLTGPVTSRASAWRGEATIWMPKRPRSYTVVLSTLISTSQPLQPPALTWRTLSERPKIRRISSANTLASLISPPRIFRSSLRETASR